MRLFFAFSLAMITSFSLTSERNRENVQHASREEDRSLSLIFSAISAKSIQDWASLWENDCYPMQLKDLELDQNENIELFNFWILCFHYWKYSEYILNQNDNCQFYINVLKEAQLKSKQNERTKEYFNSLIHCI